MKKLPKDELMRQAFILAERERRSLAWNGEVTQAEADAALDLAKQLQEYRRKRWGDVEEDAYSDVMENLTPTPLHEIAGRGDSVFQVHLQPAPATR